MSISATTGTPTSQQDRELHTLDAKHWHEALKNFAGSAAAETEMVGDTVRRSQAGMLTVRDMRLVLVARADAPAWAPARQAVIDFLTVIPERARQVLATHTQVEVWPPTRFERVATVPKAPGGMVTVAAVVGPAGSQVTGPAQSAATEREAKDRAALALLARIAGVVPPGEVLSADAVVEPLVLPGMPTELFEQRVRRRLEAGHGPDGELEAEALHRAEAGRLRHRDLYLLLLSGHVGGWTHVREAALHRAAAMPPAPAQLLHWYAEQNGEERGLTYEEQPVDAQGRHHVRAQLTTGERTVSGPTRSALGRKAARHSAACALLAQLADLPEPAQSVEGEPTTTSKIMIPGQGQDPLRYLNKYQQLETITKPEASVRTMGSRVEVTYLCRHLASGALVQAGAVDRDKATAREAAALKLLRKLSSLQTNAFRGGAHGKSSDRPLVALAEPEALPTDTKPVQRPVLQASDRQADALLLDAVTVGCAITFVPAGSDRPAEWSVQDNGRQALPVSGLPGPISVGRHLDGRDGWRIPLLEAVPVLRRTHPGASATAVFWQRAVHIALQLVAARLIYPVLSDDGHASWRVGPLPAVAEQALSSLAAVAPPGAVQPVGSAAQALTGLGDALADALVRTPAAALFGNSPWTGPVAQVLDRESKQVVRGWLDGVEDRADGGPAPLLVLRIANPTDDQATAGRLTADLHLASAGADSEAQDAVPAGQVWAGTARLSGHPSDLVRPRVLRSLRRAARRWPALAALAAQEHPQRCTLHPGAIEALLEHESELAEQGVRVVWPVELRTALKTTAVVGTEPEVGTAGHRPAGPGVPRFSVSALLDFRWQVAMDGVALTEEEMDALAEAARPLVRVRGRWVLADPVLRHRARHRLLGTLPGTQALTATLTGTVRVDEALIPCRPAGPLADMIGVLTGGEHRPEPVPAPYALRATLRGYQQRALTWLAHITGMGFGTVLADDMGLGKTLTALAFTLHHQQHTPGPTLVICPASLVTAWVREAARFTPDLPVLAYHGPERSLESVTDTTMVVTTYGVLRRDQARLSARTWSLVVADEAQHAKNPASATARELRALPSTTRLALTGTPVENNLSELWALLDWVNPGLFGTLKTYRSRWASAAEKDPDGAEATELGKVIAPFLLRRLKSDPGIAPELPSKIHQPRLVRLTTEQAGLYEALVREALQQIQDSSGISRHGMVFKLLTALKKITNHPAHYLREDPATAAGSAEFTARSAKAAALMDLLEAIRARSEASLIFTSYVAMGHLLHHHLDRHGYDPLFVHGATPLPERQRMVDAFQAGRHPVMILSLKAAGTGLTLTRAAHVIHYDRSWNAAVEDQASDRAHRIGQQQTVTVHPLITEHTVEDRIDELLTHKRALASSVLTGGDRALAQLTDRELADLVTLGAR
ncbi:SNF2-related protein [Streptomyces sp. NPDC054865]